VHTNLKRCSFLIQAVSTSLDPTCYEYNNSRLLAIRELEMVQYLLAYNTVQMMVAREIHQLVEKSR